MSCLEHLGCFKLHKVVAQFIAHGEWHCRFCGVSGAESPLVLHWRSDALLQESSDLPLHAFFPYCLTCHEAEHELRQDAETALTTACGTKLHAFDVFVLARGIEEIPPDASPEEVIRAIAWIMMEPEAVRALLNQYKNN